MQHQILLQDIRIALAEFGELFCHHLFEDDIHVGLRLLVRNAGLQAAYYMQPHDLLRDVAGVVFEPHTAGHDLRLHVERDPKIGRIAYVFAKKMGPRHAHDGQVGFADVNAGIQHGERSAETPLPEFIADDGEGSGTGAAFVGGRECAADGGGSAEHGEIAAADQTGAQLFGRLAVDAGVVAVHLALRGEHTGERLRAVAQGLEFAIREDTALARGCSDVHAAGVGIGQGDQLLRVFHRQHLQQHRVDKTEDCGIGADAERQGEHCHRGEAGALCEQAGSIDEILTQFCDSRHMGFGRTTSVSG